MTKNNISTALSAVAKGDLAEVQRLVRLNENFYQSTRENGYKLVCAAIQARHKDIVNFLIDFGLETSNSNNKRTVLHEAVVHGSLEIIHFLEQKGFSLVSEDIDFITPFFLIAKRKPDEECSKILKYFLIKGFKVDSKHKESHFTLTHFAAESGNTFLIRLLKKKKFPLNDQAKYGYTPLHVAVINGQVDAVALLMKLRVNFETRSTQYLTPLRLALIMDKAPITKLIFNQTLRFRKNNYEGKFGSFLLYCASAIGDRERVKLFLSAGAYVNTYVISTGNTPLLIAVEKEFEEIIKLLLQYGANRNMKQLRDMYLSNNTALHIATMKNNIRIVKILLEHELRTPNEFIFTIFALNAHNMTPYHIAIQRGYNEVQQLFKNKALSVFENEETQMGLLTALASSGPSKILQFFMDKCTTLGGMNELKFQFLLVLAAQSKEIEVLEVLCRQALQFDSWEMCYFALYAAAYYGREDMVKYLLENEVDPNECAEHCLPVLHAAAQMNRENIFKILLEYRAKIIPETDHFSSILHAAVLGRNEKIVNTILINNVKIDVKLQTKPKFNWDIEPYHNIYIQGSYYNCDMDENGAKKGLKLEYTPLHFAAEEGLLTIVDRLLIFGANPYVTARINKIEKTPIMLAMNNKHVTVVARLFRASIRCIEENLSTILGRAITSRSEAMVQLLIKENAPINEILELFPTNKGYRGFTPLHVAIAERDVKILGTLLKAKAIVDVETEQDFPLHYAIEEGSQDMIKKLIKYGASLEERCSHNITPIFHAVKGNNVDTLQYLLRIGVPLEMVTEDDQSLLMFAIRNKVTRTMLKFLLSHGIMNFESHRNPSFLYDILKYEIDISSRRRLSKKKKVKKCRTKAEDYYHEEKKNWLLYLFLKSGCDPNTWSFENEESILHFAVKDRRASAVDILLNFGADINVVDTDGHTPLLSAVDHIEQFHLAMEGDLENLADQSNLSQMEVIVRSFISATARLLATGRDVSEQNKSVIAGEEYFRSYLRHCFAEIRSLMAERIHSDITFFNIFEADEKRILRYSRNRQIKKRLRAGFGKQFPIYSRYLKFRLQLAAEKLELIEKNQVFFSKIGRPDIPHLVQMHLLEELDHIDLTVLDNV